MVKEPSELLEEARSLFGQEVLTLIYSVAPYEDEQNSGIQPQDLDALAHVLDKINFKNFCLILHGPGGDFKTSIWMAHLISNNQRKYQVYVPMTCSSALCMLFLKADRLHLTPSSRITQFDPIFNYDGNRIRAIQYLKSQDEDLKEKSRQHFQNVRDLITSIISESPSLFDFEKEDFEKFGDGENLVNIFMNKEEHHKEVTYEELNSLNYKVNLIENPDTITFLKDVVRCCMQKLKDEDHRVMIASSKKFKAEENEEEGNWILLK